jgi:release factor glutamine methyltransferase
MHSVGKRVRYEGFTFLVDEDVYEPAEDSFLFAENLPVEKFRRVLDVGTGCGILGIVEAGRAEEVFSLDVSPFAVRCARQNARLNEVIDKIDFIEGDLFSPFDRRAGFDLILFNAPYLPSENRAVTWIERSWAGGRNGREIIDRFIDQAPRFLRTGGQILLMQSSLSNVDETLRRYAGSGLEAEVVARQTLPFFEEIVLVAASRPRGMKP